MKKMVIAALAAAQALPAAGKVSGRKTDDCMFGAKLSDTARYRDVVAGPQRTLTRDSGVTALEAKQIVAGMDREDVKSVDEAFAAVDEGKIFVRTLTDWHGRHYVLYDYTAGDNQFGFVLEAYTTKVVAELVDSNFETCAVEAPDLNDLGWW